MKELLTARFRLRGLRDEDLPALVAMNRDPEVMRYVRKPGSDAEERQKAVELIAKYRGEPLGVWAIEGRDDGAYLGNAMLLTLPGSEDIEVGYRLPQSSWGRGIATEAATRLRDYGFEEIGLEEIVAVTDPENAASQHVLRKIGLSFRGLRRAYDTDGLHFFAIRRAEWEKL